MKLFKLHFLAVTVAVGVMLLGFMPSAYAVPSFARQTGMACAACHVEFPELGHFGRDFKLSGYTLTMTPSVEEKIPVERLGLNATPPFSAMLQTSYTRVKKAQPDTGGVAGTAQNGNLELPQQMSLFYAGRITPNVGSFIQLTYDGVADKLTIDNTDIRIAENTSINGNRLTYGVTINNNPTVQDLWNTAPAWGFPYASSPVAPAPTAATLLDGPLAQQVGGVGVYGGYHLGKDMLYAELSEYRSMQPGMGKAIDSTAANDVIKGFAPYIRLAYEHVWDDNTWEFGLFNMKTKTTPHTWTDTTVTPNVVHNYSLGSPPDTRTDLAFDTQFQHHATDSTFSIQAIRIREKQDWVSSLDNGMASNAKDTLTTTKLSAKYYFKREYGATIQHVQTKGDADTALYSGSANHSPDSSNMTYELDYMPRDNIRFALQYVNYSKFDGGGTNYDGAGRDAKDNNTLYLYGWFMF